jgi:conjugal transfer mating pair stabilization protein TraN
MEKQMFFKLLFLLFNFIFVTLIFANSPTNLDRAFHQGESIGEQYAPSSEKAMEKIPNEPGLNFSSNPEATKYFKNSDQRDPGLIDKGIAAIGNSLAGSAVDQSIDQRPFYQIESGSSGMKRSNNIINNAADIVEGVGNQYADCSKINPCKTEYKITTCNIQNDFSSKTCRKNLNINFKHQAQDFFVDLDLKGHFWFLANQAKLTISLETGEIISKSSNVTEVKTNIFPSFDYHFCPQENITYSGYQIIPENGQTLVTINENPSCQNHLQLSVTFNKMENTKVRLKFHVSFLDPENYQEIWLGDCGEFEKDYSCFVSSEQCLDQGGERIIDNIKINKNCWQKNVVYHCGQKQISDTCSNLLNQGCEQISSNCANKKDDSCVSYQQTFRCPVKKCNGSEGIVCGGKIYCLKGDCSNHDYQKSEDFNKAVSALSGAAEGSKDLDHEQQLFFKGEGKDCRRDAFNFCDCCSDTGWGKDFNLAKCDEKEKQLAVDKNNKLTVELGEYCDHETLGICTSHKKKYCVFRSKLARIIQEGGRQQLGISFGSPQNPDCRGLTVEEMQKIDFSKLDFSDFYHDLNNQKRNIDQDLIKRNISQRVREKYEQKK